ncbi:MAG: outer membrane beta-barrel protein, partial [Bacteroidota bacterium]
ATQNLPADAVEKVQVFDKKSDLAEFSGIEDGQEEKTINLALKADKKAGYFGKVAAGYGTDQRFEHRGNVNRFSGKMQLSAIGMWNNTNKQGFSINDYINFMGGLQNMTSGNGGSISFNSDDAGLPLDFGGNNGIVNTGASGLNFNYDFNKKTQLRSSYIFSRIERNREQTLYRQNFLETGNFDFSQTGLAINRNYSHRLNLRLEHEIDSFSNLILQTTLGQNDARVADDQTTQTFDSSQLLENDSEQTYLQNRDNLDWRTNLTYRRRFRKKGRVLVAGLSLRTLQNQADAELAALNRFYAIDGVQINAIDSLQQEQEQSDDQLEYGADVSYTEPLGKGHYLGWTYAWQSTHNDLDKAFFDTGLGQKTLNTSLSNGFERQYRYQRGGINFRLNRKRFNWNMAWQIQHATLTGIFTQQDQRIQRSFVNWLPSFSGNLDFAASRNLTFSYRTSVQEPTLTQLQPIVDNSNPLRIYVGNPDLRPEYQHNLNLRFLSFDQFSFTNIFASLRARYTRNRITNARSVDDRFRQTVRPVNVKDDLLLDGNISFGTPIRAIKSRINIELKQGYNQARVVLNDQEEQSKLWSTGFNFSIENRKKEVVDLVLGMRWSFNQNRYSISQTLNQSYFNHTYYLDLNVTLGGGWTLSSSLDYAIYSAEQFGDRQTIPIWKAEVSKLLFRDRLELRVSAFDLLNKNVGLDRRSAWNYIEEERVRSLERYFLLSMVYSLSGFK